MAMYESETTVFLRSLKQLKPHLPEAQRQGRALLWDRTPQDLDLQRRNRESRVAQPAYVYFSPSRG